ncbi:FHA domain-containing protein [Planctomycetota bacterium]
MDPVAMKSLTFIGISIINTCTAIGVTLGVTKKPGVGLVFVLAGGVVGAVLIYLEQKRGVRAPWMPRAPLRATIGTPPRTVPAGQPAAGQSASRPSLRPPPDQMAPRPAPPEIGPDEDTHRTPGAIMPGDLRDEATLAEGTLVQSFTPDYSARAVKGLTDIYKELESAGVNGYLLIIDGPDRDRSLAVESLPITIGRAPFNKLQLRDQSISTEQATVIFQDGHVYVTDNKSKNGTYVNNERVVSQKLDNCDIIAFGSTKILVTLP